MSDTSDVPPARFALPQSRAVRIGLALFVLGLLFVVGDVIWWFSGGHDSPVWLNVLCMLAPAGFLVAVWSALRAGRAEQRAALRDVADWGG